MRPLDGDKAPHTRSVLGPCSDTEPSLRRLTRKKLPELGRYIKGTKLIITGPLPKQASAVFSALATSAQVKLWSRHRLTGAAPVPHAGLGPDYENPTTVRYWKRESFAVPSESVFVDLPTNQ